MASVDELVKTLGQTTETGLSHFRRLVAESKIKPGQFGPREELCKLVWWHQVTADGLESVGTGGKPYAIYASDDEMDARAVGRQAGKTVEQLATAAEEQQRRLAKAASQISDPNATVFIHDDGREDSVVQRLEAMTKRWQDSIEDIQAM